jgi:arginase
MPARRRLLVIDAPSNLGLRPPSEGSVPGCYKLPWALREAGLLEGLPVVDGGVVVPPRYEASWQPDDGDRNADAIADYSERLAVRLGDSVAPGTFLVVLGGDCSILIGVGLALRRSGRHGLVFLDGHSDFRHPHNSPAIGAAAGEDLAIVTGRGDDRLIDLGGLGPYFDDDSVVAVGMRDNDTHLDEMRVAGIETWPTGRLRGEGIGAAASRILQRVARPDLEGFWIHLDVDILDPEIMPAVDTPTPGGLTGSELRSLLAALMQHPKAIGIDIGIFDPDLDSDGNFAHALTGILRPALDTA